MRISDWGSDVCSSDLGEKNGAAAGGSLVDGENAAFGTHAGSPGLELQLFLFVAVPAAGRGCRGSATRSRLFDLGQRRPRLARLVFLHWLPCGDGRSEEHTSELQSLMRISYAVFCLKQKINN